ncbi:Uma2 family endonuclease [Spirosoma sp. KUDC1026]|uniref:Uma2 family endonuclease n=1 Tax=Spirosoma sp. KUDC1026 TaxID=2745947 RepID=UPI00159BE863|nr:Uma2 family endonuclease [Spirosoma sp. KUDC1026]QKZ13176.1 Uma2 family endonuclease [Spirosoma sp. KUDC1026]
MIPVDETITPKKNAMTLEQRRRRRLLLNQLVYEMEDEKPVYYAGYREVLNGTKVPEEIMGSSGLQSFLVEIIQRYLFAHPFNRRFRYLSSEVGVQLRKKKWRACDIAIYERERLKGYEFTNKYMSVAPDYVIEIDTKADLAKYQYQQAYFIKKTRELHEFGAKKVIWIFTENVPVIWESEADGPIIIRDGWNHDITITDGMTFNLAALYDEAQKE